MMNAEQTPTAMARLRRREADQRRSEREAFDALLARPSRGGPPKVIIQARGGMVAMKAINAGKVALVLKLADGTLEFCTIDGLAGGEAVRYPIPLVTPVQAIALWVPPTCRARSLRSLLKEEAAEAEIVGTRG